MVINGVITPKSQVMTPVTHVFSAIYRGPTHVTPLSSRSATGCAPRHRMGWIHRNISEMSCWPWKTHHVGRSFSGEPMFWRGSTKKKTGSFPLNPGCFYRAPFWLVYSYNRHITEESLYTLNNQVFFIAHLTPSNSTVFLVVHVLVDEAFEGSEFLILKNKTPNRATYKLRP